MYQHIKDKHTYFIADELVKYYKHPEEARQQLKQVKIKSASNVREYLKTLIEQNNHKEHFVAIYLDRANVVNGFSVISSGDVAGTCINTRTIFAPAIQGNASALIIAHNHPSGNLKPSKSDIEITKQIKEAGKVLNIELLVSIIYTSASYTSLQYEGVL